MEQQVEHPWNNKNVPPAWIANATISRVFGRLDHCREHRLIEPSPELSARLSESLPRTSVHVGGAFPQLGATNTTRRETMRTLDCSRLPVQGYARIEMRDVVTIFGTTADAIGTGSERREMSKQPVKRHEKLRTLRIALHNVRFPDRGRFFPDASPLLHDTN